MITILVEDFNHFSQKDYNDIISSIQFHQLTCSCGHSACLSVHAYYYRYIRTPKKKVRIRICRVKCSVCGRTHALLVLSIVPYSQIPVDIQRQVAMSVEDQVPCKDICEDHPHIDDNSIKALIRRYKNHWKERLASEKIPLSPVRSLTKQCFALYSAQFMQVRRTANLLFAETT